MAKGLDYVINLLGGNSEGVEHAKKKIGEVDGAIAGVERHSNTFAKTIATLGLVIGGVFATEKIVDFGKEALNAAKATRMAAAQVAQGIETTGGVAGRTLEELREQAEKLENMTLFGDEQTLGAQSIVLTFTKIRGAIFDQAIPAIQDLATRMGGEGPADLKGAAVQVGKALNDPIQGLTALRRVGVSFTDVQKKQIEYMQTHNNLAGAQKLILAELNTEFGGSALAARKAAGPQADLKVAYDNLLKAVGPLIQEGLTPLVTWLTKGVIAITHVVSGLGGLSNIAAVAWSWTKKVAEAAADLAIGMGLVAAAYVVANPMIIAYGASVAINAVATAGLTIATYAMTAAQWALNLAMDANPIGLIIVGIGALIGGLIYAYHHSEKFRAILAGIGEIASELVPVFKGLGEIILGSLTFNPILVVKGFKDAYDGVAKVIADGGIGGAFNKGYDASIKSSREQEKKDAAVAAAANPVKAGESAKKPAIPGAKAKVAGAGGTGSGTFNNQATAAGKSVTHVTMNIKSLINNLTMQVTNLQGKTSSELKRAVTELLVEAAQDAHILIGAE